MTVEEAVIGRLQELSPLTALVGTRVTQLTLPQGTILPAVRVQLIDELRSYHHRGRTLLLNARVQVDAYAQTYSAALAVADAVLGDGNGSNASGLDGWQGSIGSPAFNIRAVMQEDRSVLYEADELRLVRVRQDFRVWGEQAS